MSPSLPPTPSMRVPAGGPPSGNTKSAIIVLLLVLGTIGVIVLKMKSNEPVATGPVRPISTFDAAPISHNDDNSVPAPPRRAGHRFRARPEGDDDVRSLRREDLLRDGDR